MPHRWFIFSKATHEMLATTRLPETARRIVANVSGVYALNTTDLRQGRPARAA